MKSTNITTKKLLKSTYRSTLMDDLLGIPKVKLPKDAPKRPRWVLTIKNNF